MSSKFVCDMVDCQKVIGDESKYQFEATFGEIALQVDFCDGCAEKVGAWLTKNFIGEIDD